jgi:alpha-amylase/alpha-mannosidase (GH57 family)/carbohydrate-binding DOMON domain-containing protein
MRNRVVGIISVIIALLMVVSMFSATFSSTSSSRGFQSYNISATIGKENVIFTGNVSADFSGDLIFHNTVRSLWTSENNISDLYVAYNTTYLFIGLNETVSGNNLMIFLSNDTSSGYGLYNLSKLAQANGYSGKQLINFTEPVNAVFDVYFSSPSTYDTPALYSVTSSVSQSNNTASAKQVNLTYKFDSAHNTTELAIPFSDLYAIGNYTSVNISLSAFVVGNGNGPWVGIGAPYYQTGKYNKGTQGMFTVNDSYVFNLSNIQSKSVSITPPPPSKGVVPINLNIILNDHQPMYKVVGSNNYVLPWTEAHATAEYIEQALILHMFPKINVTYEMSGSLLSQLVNISTDPYFNDTYIQGAFIPWSEINSNQSLYNTLTSDYFSIPAYVFALDEPASHLYSQLHSMWVANERLNETQFENAKVLWFLYDISTPLVEGELGSSWTNSTIWGFHNQTSFNQSDLVKILQYSKWLTGQVIPAFRNDIIGNPSGSNNSELFTSPFYHPIVPLLLATNISGPSGTIYKSSYYSDVMAQINISFGQFNSLFGQYPSGLYAPEAAVSYGMIQAVNSSGATWFQTAQATLDNSGVAAKAYGDAGSNVTTMENLYQPYIAVGPNNTTSYVFFRDGYVSGQWGFNYGSEPTWTAVDNFINYLKAIYNAIPMEHHNQTVVTVLLDGENWMFMSPFAEDGVPFLIDLYTALEQNASFIRTVTPTQYLHFAAQHDIKIQKLYHLATASWNPGSGAPLPYQSNIYLTQWSGDTVQDFYWQALQNVRSMVVDYQQQHNLVQLQNYTPFEQNMTANTPEGNLTRAWNAIYDAEGSDWYFTMAPWTIGGSNTLPFDYLFKSDLAYALKQLSIPVPSYLVASPMQPLVPFKTVNTSTPETPTLNGYPQYTEQEQGGLAFALNDQNSWTNSAIYNGTPGSGINNVSLTFDASDIFVQINVTGNPLSYITNPSSSINLFFSQPDQGYSSNISMDVQSATFQTPAGSLNIGFPAVYMVSLAPSTFKGGFGQYNVYLSTGIGTWSYQTQDINVPAYIGTTIQFLIPFNYLNYVPGNSFEMAAFASNTSSSQYSMVSPMYQLIPLTLAEYTPVSSIHNTVPDNGPGNYTYPEQPTQIPPTSLDLKWINVSMNSFDMKWEFTFGQLWNIWSGAYGFSNQIINIFISDGSSSGSKSLGMGPNANVTEPWQTELYISGFATYALTQGGQQTNGIIVSVNYTSATVTTVFPLAYIGTTPLDYNYTIISGSYDGYGVNGWRIVDASNTSNGGWQGGGGDPPWSSNIYDYIAPATVGEGTLTQQQALQYSVHHIPTLEPIKLPPISNVSITQKSYFNSTYYNMPSMAQFDHRTFVSYISNVSGARVVYVSSSSNLRSWVSPVSISGSAGAITDQLVASNDSLFLVLLLKSNVEVFSSVNGVNWNVNFSESISTDFISAAYSGSSIYLLMSNEGTNGSYSYHIQQIQSGRVVNNYSLSFTGASTASLSAFDNYFAVGYYSGPLNNQTILVKVVSATSYNVVSTIEMAKQSNITGNISLAADSSGNIFISYTTVSAGTYSIIVSNATFLAQTTFKKVTVLVSSSSVNDNPMIYLENTGASNYSLLAIWHTTTSFQNLILVMNTSIAFEQYGVLRTPSTHPSTNNDLTLLIIGIVLAAVIVSVIGVLYLRKRRSN